MLHIGLALCYRRQCNLASTSKQQGGMFKGIADQRSRCFEAVARGRWDHFKRCEWHADLGGCHHISVEVTNCRPMCSLRSLVFCLSVILITDSKRCSIEQVPPQNGFFFFFFKQPLVSQRRVAEPVRKHFLLIRPEL